MQMRLSTGWAAWTMATLLCGCSVLSAVKLPHLQSDNSHSEMREQGLSLYATVLPESFEIVLVQLDYYVDDVFGQPYYDGKHVRNPVTRPADYDATSKVVRYTFTPEEMTRLTDERTNVFYEWVMTYKLPNGNDTAVVYSSMFRTSVKDAKELPGTNNTRIIPP
jgi:hypothetical protein